MFISNFNRFCFRTDENYYPQVFLQELKYVLKEKKIPKYIIDNIDIFSDSDFDKENTDKDSLDKGNSTYENYDEGNSENVSVYKNGN